MNKLSDIELLNEIKLRFDANNKLITEQRNLMRKLTEVNEKLLLSEKVKSNFLSNIRNEINNPMTSVLGLAKHCAESNLPIEKLKVHTKIIHNEIANLDFQLKNIFASAEIEAGETQLAINAINVFSLIEGTIKSFSHQMEEKKIRLIVTNKLEQNQLFYTDSEKLHLIISNLLSNAIRFSYLGGTIIITCEIIDEALCVSISDEGIGINTMNKEKIFDRFSQIEVGSTKSFMGHGLGLCIIKSFLEIIGGEILIESELNKGSTFTIKVPQANKDNYSDAIFSSDGNDFLFDSDNEVSF